MKKFTPKLVQIAPRQFDTKTREEAAEILEKALEMVKSGEAVGCAVVLTSPTGEISTGFSSCTHFASMLGGAQLLLNRMTRWLDEGWN